MHNKTCGRQWKQLVHDMSQLTRVVVCEGGRTHDLKSFCLPSDTRVSVFDDTVSCKDVNGKTSLFCSHLSDLALSVHNAPQLCYEL